MTTRTIPCRVCGKLFVPCNKPSSTLGAFNYHSIACSPECGAEYLRLVREARQKSNVEQAPDAVASTDEIKTEDNVVDEPVNEPVNDTSKRTRGKRREVVTVEEAMDETEE